MNPRQVIFYLVVCIAECMMRCSENNHNVHEVHDGYEDPSARLDRKSVVDTHVGKQDLFRSVNMKKFGCCKVRKHKEIKGSEKCVTLNIYEILNISEKFDSLNKIETTSSESKVELERSGKMLVTALVLKTKAMSKKIQKVKVCHRKCQHEGPFQQKQRV